jgi:hypothetical protein
LFGLLFLLSDQALNAYYPFLKRGDIRFQ